MTENLSFKNYVLWLVSWYPSRVDALNGDFIERQAKAASLYQDIVVVYVIKDSSKTSKAIIIEKNVIPHLTTYIAYYPGKSCNWKWIRRTGNIYRYFKANKLVLKQVYKENGKHDIVHAHVTFLAGLMALYLKITKGWQYILTEHWTYYHPSAHNNYYNKTLVEKFFVKKILRNTLLILPVSCYLRNKMNAIVNDVSFQIISNVVDTSLFYNFPKAKKDNYILIHVSSMINQKRPDSIIKSFAFVADKIRNWKLYMIGPADGWLINIARDYGLLNEQIFFTGEITYAEVAEKTRMADASILFSKYETQGCVILEALCCGVPVIAPDIPPITEMINSDNGLLFPQGNEDELRNAIIYLANNIHLFDRQRIAATAQKKYNYAKIGSEINDVYHKFLSR